MSETVIVTGGAGYIGSHACKALAAAGYTPVAYDNFSTGNRWSLRWGPVEYGDILDFQRFSEVVGTHRPVGVMHFAALALVGESVREPGRYHRVNTTGALNVIEACRLHQVPAFVFSSTCAVYGQPAQVPIHEEVPLAPVNPYGVSKLAAERILADYEMAHGLRYCALRYFNAAGADPDGEIGERRDVETHLVPLVLDSITGRRPPLKVFGDDYDTPDGTAVRDYIHVTDLAEAHVKALRHLLAGGQSECLNLGTGTGYSVRQVIEEASRVTGRAVPHETAARRPGDPARLVADPAKSLHLLGNALTMRSDLGTILETAWKWQSGETYARSFGD